MKVSATFRIDDAVLDAAKAKTADEGVTLTSVVEAALRDFAATDTDPVALAARIAADSARLTTLLSRP